MSSGYVFLPATPDPEDSVFLWSAVARRRFGILEFSRSPPRVAAKAFGGRENAKAVSSHRTPKGWPPLSVYSGSKSYSFTSGHSFEHGDVRFTAQFDEPNARLTQSSCRSLTDDIRSVRQNGPGRMTQQNRERLEFFRCRQANADFHGLVLLESYFLNIGSPGLPRDIR